jgi:uncharacterized protein YutE (UPF0331/DUF86 family)
VKTVEKKMSSVIDRIERLRAISRKLRSYKEYKKSDELKDAAERNLQIAIEGCFDIGKIIISEKKLPEPKDYKGIFEALAEAGIISGKSLEFLIPMAGTRNILDHSYDKIDDGHIYGILKRHLNDFEVYLSEVRDNYLLRK